MNKTKIRQESLPIIESSFPNIKWKEDDRYINEFIVLSDSVFPAISINFDGDMWYIYLRGEDEFYDSLAISEYCTTLEGAIKVYKDTISKLI